MTDPTRTERRLLQSIRSAKTGSPGEKGPDAASHAEAVGENRHAAEQGPVVRGDAIGAREAAGLLVRGQGGPRITPVDVYQRFRRIWPD